MRNLDDEPGKTAFSTARNGGVKSEGDVAMPAEPGARRPCPSNRNSIQCGVIDTHGVVLTWTGTGGGIDGRVNSRYLGADVLSHHRARNHLLFFAAEVSGKGFESGFFFHGSDSTYNFPPRCPCLLDAVEVTALLLLVRILINFHTTQARGSGITRGWSLILGRGIQREY